METTLLPPPSTNGLAPSPSDVLSTIDNPSHTFPHSNGGRIKEGGPLQPSSLDSLSPHGGERAGDRGRQTGPKTLAGKSQSRLNALKHSLTACDTLFLTGLDPSRREAYFSLRQMLRRYYRPVTEMERLLVDRIAVNQFRILCLCRLEAQATARTPENLNAACSVVPHLDRFSCYDTRLERQNRVLHNRLMCLYQKRGVSWRNLFDFKD